MPVVVFDLFCIRENSLRCFTHQINPQQLFLVFVQRLEGAKPDSCRISKQKISLLFLNFTAVQHLL